MIDWHTVTVGYNADYLEPDRVMCISSAGEIKWHNDQRIPVLGSYDDRIMIGRGSASKSMLDDRQHKGFACSDTSNLWISGNPVKFISGHNVFGPPVSQRFDLLDNLIKHHLGAYTPDIDEQTPATYETRVDIATMVNFGSHNDVHDWIYTAQRATRSRSGRPATNYDTTVYWGQRSTLWSLKAYCKHCELLKHPPNHPDKDGIIADVKGMLRLELVLRSKELRKLEQRQIELDESLIWQYAQERIRGIELKTELLENNPSELKDLGLSTGAIACLINWRSGNDPKTIYPHKTFYRHRKDILNIVGVDISNEYNPEIAEKKIRGIKWLMAHEVKYPGPWIAGSSSPVS